MKNFLKAHWRPIVVVLVGFALLGSQLLFGLWVGFLLGRYGRRLSLKLTKKADERREASDANKLQKQTRRAK